MREEFYFESKSRSEVISMDIVNHISQELIATVNGEKELNSLLEEELKMQDARRQALLIAYKEYPNPTGFISLDDRRALVEKRNQLVETLIEKFMAA